MNKYIKNLNRLEFSVTLACTGKCKHWSQGNHVNCTEYIDGDVLGGNVNDTDIIKLLDAYYPT